ncbi:hypothetical protein K7432_013792, partial [Basidiobolus ranarum]
MSRAFGSLRSLSKASLSSMTTRRYRSRTHEIVARALQATREAGTIKPERIITTPHRNTLSVQAPNDES